MNRIVTTLILILSTLCLFAQENGTPGWVAHKADLIPLKYTTNHFNLNDKVKSMKETRSFSKDVETWYFDGLGRLSKSLREQSVATTTTNYDYSTKGKIIQNSKWGETTFPNNYYLVDKNGLVTEQRWASKTDTGVIVYTYNKKKLLTNVNISYNSASKDDTRYTYNAKNQIVEINRVNKFFNYFTYNVKDKLIVVSHKTKSGDGSNNQDNEYTLDATGNNIVKEFTKYPTWSSTSAVEYIFDSKGNWIKKVVKNVENPNQKPFVYERVFVYY